MSSRNIEGSQKLPGIAVPDISKSANYDNGAYDRMEAYYYLEIVPEIGATTYRGDKLLIQVGDKIR